MSDELTSPPETEGPGYRVEPKTAGINISPSARYANVPRIKGDADLRLLRPGSTFIDPEGNQRTKPWEMTDDRSLERIPEGADFIDPEGNLRTKPKFEGVDFTTQTLFDMSLTDSEKRKALARTYGDENIKVGADGTLHVEKDGQYFKPGRGDTGKRVAAGAASMAAPTLGGIGGVVLGAPAGGVGGIAGGAAGAAAGQGFNDLILSLAGIYDRSLGEEATNLAIAGAGGGAGGVTGRMVGATVQAGVNAGRAVGSGVRNMAPRAVARYLGADVDPAATQAAVEMANKGVLVPPSAWMKEAPYLKKVVEEFDPAFRQQDVLATSAGNYYEDEVRGVLTQLGVTRPTTQPLTAATEQVSSKEAGEGMIKRAQAEVRASDQALDAAMADAKQSATSKATGEQAELDARIARLEQAQATNRTAAQTVVDQGYAAIDKTMKDAVKAAGTGGNSGELMERTAQQIQAVNAAVKARASRLYSAADAAAGDVRPDVSSLSAEAAAFRDQLPEPFKAKYPDVVKAIESLAGKKEVRTIQEPTATGHRLIDVEVAAGEPPTFGQLRQVRSILRHGFDYGDLSPGIREGAMKFFAKRVNEVIHDAEAAPALKAASQMLDQADAFYAKNMPKFRDKVMQGLVDGLSSGMPADPQVVAGMIFKEGQTERMRTVRKVIGPNLWSAVQAADTQSMFAASRTLVPGEINGTVFAREVLDRVKSGVMEAGYSPQAAAALRTQAQRVAMIEGKLPLEHMPGDTVSTFLSRAEAAAKEAVELSKVNPLGELQKDIKAIEASFAEQKGAAAEARKADPTRFLNNAGAKAIASADRIISDPDLLIAASVRFGENSPEFTALRQVAAERLFQRSVDGAYKLSETFRGMTPEVQRLLFPGVSLDDALTLAKNMQFLTPASRSDAGGSIAAANRVLHPWGSLQVFGTDIGAAAGKVPGVNAVGRGILGSYFKLMTYGSTHPAFMNWVARGVSGTPQQRMQVRDVIAQLSGGRGAEIGNMLGAGTGGGVASLPENETPIRMRGVRRQ